MLFGRKNKHKLHYVCTLAHNITQYSTEWETGLLGITMPPSGIPCFLSMVSVSSGDHVKDDYFTVLSFNHICFFFLFLDGFVWREGESKVIAQVFPIWRVNCLRKYFPQPTLRAEDQSNEGYPVSTSGFSWFLPNQAVGNAQMTMLEKWMSGQSPVREQSCYFSYYLYLKPRLCESFPCITNFHGRRNISFFNIILILKTLKLMSYR